MSIYSLSYHSRNRIEDLTLDTRLELAKILEVSVSRNAAHGISGALMFNDGRFAQILEGDRDAVKAAYESIRHDPRHTEVTILSTQTLMVRRFGSWAMTFVGTTPAAREYYKSFAVNTDTFLETLQQDRLCQMMLEMIDIDRRCLSDLK